MLRGCDKLTDRSIIDVSKYLPHLVSLDVSACDRVTNVGLAPLGTVFPCYFFVHDECILARPFGKVSNDAHRITTASRASHRPRQLCRVAGAVSVWM